MSINRRRNESIVGCHGILCDGPTETARDPKRKGAWMLGGKSQIPNIFTCWTLSQAERLKGVAGFQRRQMEFEWKKVYFNIIHHENIWLDYSSNYTIFLLAEVSKAKLLADKIC